MKKKVLQIVVFVIILGALVFAFMPQPIADSGIEEVVLVQANPNYGSEKSKLYDAHFVPEAVIECISRHREQRSFKTYKGFVEKDVQLRVVIRTDSEIKEIIIGKEIYCSDSSGMKYRILDSEQFKNELFEACGYSEPDMMFTKNEFGFVGTVIDETETYMVVESLNDKSNLYAGDKFKVEYEAVHYDYLYGIGRKVVVYFKGKPEELPDGTKLVKTDNISIDGFREFEIEVESAVEKEKRLILNSNDIDKYGSNVNLYYYGLDRVMVTFKGWTMTLEYALETGRITLNGIVAKANRDVADGIIEEISYDDGGSRVYKYKDYTIIKYHTLDGNRDVYIGSKDMNIQIADK